MAQGVDHRDVGCVVHSWARYNVRYWRMGVFRAEIICQWPASIRPGHFRVHRRGPLRGGQLPHAQGFLIERNFAEEVEATKDIADNIIRINDEEGVRWLFSFLSPDKRKTYCLYEAPNADAIRIAARRANLPADVVIEVSEIRPEMFA
jgi:Nickel responsive protein SCO4226-like